MSKVWHILVFRTAPEVTPKRVDEIRQMFQDCVGPCDGLEWVHAGSNTSHSPRAQGWPEGIVMQFRDRDSRDRYLVHPLHQKIEKEAQQNYYTDLVILDIDAGHGTPDPGASAATAAEPARQ
jgi:Stress responsive A/B Barrel Domain